MCIATKKTNEIIFGQTKFDQSCSDKKSTEKPEKAPTDERVNQLIHLGEDYCMVTAPLESMRACTNTPLGGDGGAEGMRNNQLEESCCVAVTLPSNRAVSRCRNLLLDIPCLSHKAYYTRPLNSILP